ncbi:MAG: hypothetical protein IM445_21640 [Microcystis sp. M015S1]|jgi:hypothetical protein|nr:hypothetical protein [Microcystis sp. M015S1]MCA3170836.1 hypothetical protein [Burkholderiales bacterium]
MSYIRVFQALVLVSALSYLLWVLLPNFPIAYSADVYDLLALHGTGAHYEWHPIIDLLFAFCKLAVSIGLFFFLSWARWLMILMVVTSVLAIPFLGVSVIPPLDSFIGAINGLVDGAIIGLFFSSPIKNYFRKDI